MKAQSGTAKSDFDFGWKKWETPPAYAEPTILHQKGDILDVGCGTCQLLVFLRKRGWKGRYKGIDSQRYEGFEYPEGIELTFGNALTVQFPEADTVTLYNILEHLEDPAAVLRKSLSAARHNVLICIPKRNEGLWKHGLAEFHQLDKTHVNCGFSKEEVTSLVELAGGKVATYRELNPTNVMSVEHFWKGRTPKFAMRIMRAVFESTEFYQEIWCEVVRGWPS